MDTCIRMHGVTWHFNSKNRKNDDNQNGLKNHICVLVCELIPCTVIRRNFQTYWSHDMDTCIRMHGVTWHFNSKNRKNDEKDMKPCLI